MANQAHLDIPAKGVETWNAWVMRYFAENAGKRESDIRPDVSGPDLRNVDLSNAFLNDARFERVLGGGTTIGKVDLSTVNSLDEVEQESPSTIGIDTIYLRKGKIPDSFLRGACPRTPSPS